MVFFDTGGSAGSGESTAAVGEASSLWGVPVGAAINLVSAAFSTVFLEEHPAMSGIIEPTTNVRRENNEL